ncbi:MAG: histidine kinase dimerization/phospho-acceptor domain-containing protein [Butyricicoccus sp.]
MNIKGILRSTAAKLIAFAGIVGCFAGALFLTEDTITDFAVDNGSNMVYRFEGDFADSYYMCQQLSIMCDQMTNAFEDGMDAAEFSRQHTDFAGNYFGRMGDKTVGDDTLTEAAAKKSAFYMIARPGSDVQSNVGMYYGYPFAVYDEETDSYGYYTEEDTAEEGWKFNKFNPYPSNTLRYALYGRTGCTHQGRGKRKTQITGVLQQVIVLTCTGAVRIRCSSPACRDEDVHLVTIDRWVEVNVLCFWAVLGTAGGLNLALMNELLSNGNDMSILLAPSILFFVAAFAFALELTLSLVRVIKNRSFVKQCWSIRFILWCWRTFIKVCECIRHSFGKLRRMLFRGYKMRNVVLLFTAYSVVLAFLAAVFGGVGGSFFVFVFGTVWFLAAGYFLIKRITGFERIVDALRRLRAGDLGFKLTDMPEGVFAEMAEDINSLGDGMQAALQNEVRAERMKSELITNVSHDLKTPLTSILNYSDLLGKMDLTPEEANDYARIIYQKGLRLKNLTSDLFDISKVQSGAEQIISERLDACTLARQALAEQDKAVQESGLTVKAAIPERELPIWADGRKLSRVLENLIGNCVKYALKGTRVFLSVAEENSQAIIELKNTANYEMDFAADEITERFVRGDAARSTEGSGLGLAIAKSYTEACGGTFDVSVDGDQFKVRIGFPVYGMTAK